MQQIPPELIEEVVKEVVGADALPTVRALKNKKNVSEFKIAELIKKEINTTRSILYRLYEANLVSFVRKKDKLKGWYIYYWTFNAESIKHLLVSLKRKRLEQLKLRLEHERKGQFFICSNACVRADFDQAMSFQFKCPECGQLMNQDDNTEKIASLEKEISTIENELKQGIKFIIKQAIIKSKAEKKSKMARIIKRKVHKTKLTSKRVKRRVIKKSRRKR